MKVMGLAIGALLAAVPTGAATLGEAADAYRQNRVAEAERLYGEIAADPAASVADRAEAVRERARIAWLVDGDAARALAALGEPAAAADRPCRTATLTARVLVESGQQAEAMARAPELLGRCAGDEEADRLRLRLIEGRLDRARIDPAARAAAATDIAALGDDAAASLAGAGARIELGLLSGDADMALRGWRDYFWLADAAAPPALARFDAPALFARGLAAGAADADRLALAELLMRAGFARALEAYLGGAAPGGSAWRRIAAYLAQRRAVEAKALEVNRGLARGRRDEKALERAVQAASMALMEAAGASGDPREALLAYYGLFGTVGMTSGYPSLHMGHAIEDRRERVRQYGHEAEVRFVAIDNMVANGFESWLWDGSAGTGGWSGGGTIVQVRPQYTGAPLRAAEMRTDTPARRELLARQAARAAEDVARARAGGGTLEGLADRLRLQVVDRVEAAARAREDEPAALRRAFLDEYWRASIDQSITVHEGRHAIDQALPGAAIESEELEYRAKLAELALADYPRLGLWNLVRNVGGTTAHGRAGARVMALLASWIGEHPDQVAGHDPALPPAVQIDRLTDAQLREIARAADPLADR